MLLLEKYILGHDHHHGEEDHNEEERKASVVQTPEVKEEAVVTRRPEDDDEEEDEDGGKYTLAAQTFMFGIALAGTHCLRQLIFALLAIYGHHLTDMLELVIWFIRLRKSS